MKSLWFKSTFTAAAVLMAVTANAQSTAKKKVTNTSTATVAPTTDEAKKPVVEVSTGHYVFGPEVTGLDKAGETGTETPGAKTGINTRHSLAVKFNLKKEFYIKAVGEGDIKASRANVYTEKMGFKLRDPQLRVGKANLMAGSIGGNKTNLDTELRLHAGLSDGSKNANNIGRASLIMMPNMQLGKSKFSLSQFNYARLFVNSKDVDIKGESNTKYEGYTGTTLNYDATDKISAYVLYEAGLSWNSLGASDYTLSPNASLTDLEPGMSFQITKAINVSPYLNWFVSQPLNTTSINLFATIKML